MFGKKSDEYKNRLRIGDFRNAARAGRKDFAINRDRYELGGLGSYRADGQTGAQQELRSMGGLNQVANQAMYGPRVSDRAYQNQLQSITAGARSDALSADGLSPAAAAAMANRNANDARLRAGGMYAQNVLQEQQGQNALAAQALQAAGGIGAGLARRGLSAEQQQVMLNDQLVGRELQAANMYLNPQAAAMAAEQAQDAQRNNSLIGGLFSAGGAALGGWMGG